MIVSEIFSRPRLNHNPFELKPTCDWLKLYMHGFKSMDIRVNTEWWLAASIEVFIEAWNWQLTVLTPISPLKYANICGKYVRKLGKILHWNVLPIIRRHQKKMNLFHKKKAIGNVNPIKRLNDFFFYFYWILIEIRFWTNFSCFYVFTYFPLFQ